jgi:isoquinoline 1-oxidoreductase beta subunit
MSERTPGDEVDSAANPSRRTLLRFAAAAAVVATTGGVLRLAFKVGGRSGQAAGFSPNALLHIDAAGRVALQLPKIEMGQGILTGIAVMVADELEVPLDSVDVLLPDATVSGVLSIQPETGGSTSTQDTWLPVRQAAAAARMMLVTAAAQRWAIDADACRARAGVVEETGGTRRIGYGELVADAARLPVPAKPAPKEAAQFTLIGQSTPRREGLPKVTGRAVYGIDVRLPGMLVATLVAPPVVGGTVRLVDDRAALAVPGVRHVVALEDLVAVVADHFWAAKRGAEALVVQWDEHGNALLQQAQIEAALTNALATPGAPAGGQGDVPAVLAGAQRHVEALYQQPFLAHATMEPANCVAHFADGRCTVWVGNQTPSLALQAAAAAAGLPVEQVTLHTHLVGGGFGRRLETDMVTIAVRIARVVPAPVKVIWSRELDVRLDWFRPAYADRLTAALDGAGKPVAWQHRIAGSSVSARAAPDYFKDGVDLDAVMGATPPPYDLPAWRVEYARVESAVRTGWWRGVGGTRNAFAIESFVDELAHAAGHDPLAYRLMLAHEPRARAVLEKLREATGWASAAHGAASHGALAHGIGRGISLVCNWGTFLAAMVEVDASDAQALRVRRVVVVVDCGQPVNLSAIRAQVEGGAVFGLSAAIYGAVTVRDGVIQQSNYHDYRILRGEESPAIDVHVMPSTEVPGGMGEPPVAAMAPALANALFAATRRRVRKLPLQS